MEIKDELEGAKQRRQEAVNRINQLEQQKQALLQEALHCDGEVRTLERLSQQDNDPAKKE